MSSQNIPLPNVPAVGANQTIGCAYVYKIFLLAFVKRNHIKLAKETVVLLEERTLQIIMKFLRLLLLRVKIISSYSHTLNIRFLFKWTLVSFFPDISIVSIWILNSVLFAQFHQPRKLLFSNPIQKNTYLYYCKILKLEQIYFFSQYRCYSWAVVNSLFCSLWMK